MPENLETALQYRFVPTADGTEFILQEPPVVLSERRKENMARLQEEWRRGINCPKGSIVDSRIVFDGFIDRFEAVIITDEGDKERAFRYLGSFPTKKRADVTLEEVVGSAVLIEDPSKVVLMRGIVLDGKRTFGPAFYPGRMIQQGGLFFKTRGQARGLTGVWEELEGNGQGAFRMIRDWKRIRETLAEWGQVV